MNASKPSSVTPEIPPELRGALPRDIELTTGGKATAFFAAILAAAAVIGAMLMSISYQQSREREAQREREAVFTSAEVTRIAVNRDDEGTRRTVTYAYEVDGRSFSGRQRLRRSDRRPLGTGDAITIGILPSEPATSWVRGYESSGFPLFVIPIVSLSLLGMAAGVAASLRRQWNMLSDGRVTLARVTNLKKVNSDKRRAYKVTCEFQTLSGAPQSSRYETGKTPPPVGSVIPILYHRDNPKRTSAYPVPLVRTVRRPESRELVN
jgi:hypothetical protein